MLVWHFLNLRFHTMKKNSKKFSSLNVFALVISQSSTIEVKRLELLLCWLWLSTYLYTLPLYYFSSVCLQIFLNLGTFWKVVMVKTKTQISKNYMWFLLNNTLIWEMWNLFKGVKGRTKKWSALKIVAIKTSFSSLCVCVKNLSSFRIPTTVEPW